MVFDKESFEKAKQEARERHLKKKAAQRQAEAEAAIQQRVADIESGVAPISESEIEILHQRHREVESAKGLVAAAASRSGLEGPTRDGGTKEASLLPEEFSAAVDWSGAAAADFSGRSSHHHHIELTEEEIARRVRETQQDVEEGSPSDVEKEKVTTRDDDLLLVQDDKRTKLEAQRRFLPIYAVRQELLELLKEHPVMILVGETGSGKTTQLLQYMYEEGLHIRRPAASSESAEGQETETEAEELRLICTQPRRIAAVSVAERVAQEVGCRCGSVVGYKVRFDDKSGPLTKILYVTDGIMLKEFTNDPFLDHVAAIMIDEAHERSLNSDIILGLLRDLTRRNKRIRVIVASATINADIFSSFFDGAPIFNVSGRTYPVDMFYSEEPVGDYATEAAETALGIHLSKPLPGDILIFLPGQDSIEACVEAIKELANKEGDHMRAMLVLPLFSSLSPKEQARIYEPTPPGIRKVVIATNIAETSITIDGIVYVLDCGLCKQNFYNPRAMTEELCVVPISKASALQRAGRAGRTQPGECFRLYTRYIYQNELPADTVPEILRCSMTSVVLQLKVLGIDNLLQFDFLSPPSTASLEIALDQLFLLGAMTADGKLTVTGRRMAEFPLDPSWSKAIIRASKLGCGRHMAMAASMLTLDSVFVNSRDPKVKRNIESAKDVFFGAGNGDVAGFVHLMDRWLRCPSHSQAMEFCQMYSIQWRALTKGRDVLDQILATMERIGLKVDAPPPSNPEEEDSASSLTPATTTTLVDAEKLTRSLLGGFFFNVARLESDKRTYTVVRPIESSIPDAFGSLESVGDSSAEIHPTSYLFKAGMQKDKGSGNGGAAPLPHAFGQARMGRGDSTTPAVLRERPFLVVFTSLRHTTRRYMLHVTAVSSAEWVLEASPEHYFEPEVLEEPGRKRSRHS